jgi:hypothetical protein
MNSEMVFQTDRSSLIHFCLSKSNVHSVQSSAIHLTKHNLSEPRSCRPRGQGQEAVRARRSFEDFDAVGSVAWQHLQAQFGVGCSFSELRSVALVVADCVGLTLFSFGEADSSWTDPMVCSELLSLVCLLDEEGTPITLARELLEMN